MNFVTVKELNEDIIKNLYRIPHDTDIVVGVPRSGMLVASLIALYLNMPLTDMASFLDRRIYESGKTKNTDTHLKSFNDIQKVLIVEDSSGTGEAMNRIRNSIQKAGFKFEYIYLAGYVTKETKSIADIYFRIIPFPRVFEWNYIHHIGFLSHACFDIDGVLCEDPTDEENDDGEKYKHFIRNAKPKFIPSSEIGWLVSSRLEKYREDTEYWMSKYGIKYKKLYMMDVSSAEERRKLGNHGEFKASVYKKLSDARCFVESEPNQADIIRSLTGKDVICVENTEMKPAGKIRRFKEAVEDGLFLRIAYKLLPKPAIGILKPIRNKYLKRRQGGG